MPVVCVSVAPGWQLPGGQPLSMVKPVALPALLTQVTVIEYWPFGVALTPLGAAGGPDGAGFFTGVEDRVGDGPGDGGGELLCPLGEPVSPEESVIGGG